MGSSHDCQVPIALTSSTQHWRSAPFRWVLASKEPHETARACVDVPERGDQEQALVRNLAGFARFLLVA